MLFWLRAGFGNASAARRLFYERVLCAGVVLGSARGFSMLWAQMQGLYRLSGFRGSHLETPNDQATLNWLFYNRSLRDLRVDVQPRGRGVVNTVGWLLGPAKNRKPGAGRACIDMQAGLIYNDDGVTLSPIVHQYDRSRELTAALQARLQVHAPARLASAMPRTTIRKDCAVATALMVGTKSKAIRQGAAEAIEMDKRGLPKMPATKRAGGAPNASSCVAALQRSKSTSVCRLANDFQTAALDTSDGLRRAALHTEVRIAIGIKAAEMALAIRMVHRCTWLRSQLICRGGGFDDDDSCQVLPQFLVAAGQNDGLLRGQLQTEAAAHRDLFVLDSDLMSSARLSVECLAAHRVCPLEERKVHWWFRLALAAHPRATHLAKMDTDTFVRPTALVLAIAGHRSGRNDSLIYYGGFGPNRCNAAATDRLLPSENMACGLDTSADALRRALPGCNCSRSRSFSLQFTMSCACADGQAIRRECFSYGQGGFYLASRRLASAVAHSMAFGDGVVEGMCSEDMRFGKLASAASAHVVHGRGDMSATRIKAGSVWSHLYYSHSRSHGKGAACTNT